MRHYVVGSIIRKLNDENCGAVRMGLVNFKAEGMQFETVD